MLSKRINVMLRSLWITDEEVKKWANGKNIFFVLAIGRSGTKFLAELLNKAPGAYVVHEPVRDDFQAHQRAFHSEEEARNYIHRFRKKEIYLRARNADIHTYGEVNGILRRHCLVLKEAFPNAKFIHLIRDGRDVVRSMMSRNTMKAEDPNTKFIYPKRRNPWTNKWPEMTRFEKLCWYWAVENRYLRKQIEKAVQLEKLVSSYDYFNAELLEPLGLKIPQRIWEKTASTPKNVTDEHVIPHWSNWDYEIMQKFNALCDEEMIRNGYEL